MQIASWLLLAWGVAPALALAAALAVVPFIEDADERDCAELYDR